MTSSIQADEPHEITKDSNAIPKRQLFIFGNDIKHSLSPALHNAGFKKCGLPHQYSIHESPTVDATVEEILTRADFGGASVTFPHKLQVGRLLDDVSESAEKVGAVNTIVVRSAEDGRRLLVGDNTDWMGIRNCIVKSGVSRLQSASALVLGAGGAARAACFALRELGIQEVVVVNRTRASAEELAARLPGINVRICESLEAAVAAGIRDLRIVVACIPADDLLEDDIPTALFSGSQEGVLVEMAYRPQVTGMMKAAGRHTAWKVYKGIDVLEEQAYAQFELWTGQPAPKETMREAMLAQIR